LKELIRFPKRKQKHRLREYPSLPINHNLIGKSKQLWRSLQGFQDTLRRMFPGLIEKNHEVEKYEQKIQSDERDKDEHRFDYY